MLKRTWMELFICYIVIRTSNYQIILNIKVSQGRVEGNHIRQWDDNDEINSVWVFIHQTACLCCVNTTAVHWQHIHGCRTKNIRIEQQIFHRKSYNQKMKNQILNVKYERLYTKERTQTEQTKERTQTAGVPLDSPSQPATSWTLLGTIWTRPCPTPHRPQGRSWRGLLSCWLSSSSSGRICCRYCPRRSLMLTAVWGLLRVCTRVTDPHHSPTHLEMNRR